MDHDLAGRHAVFLQHGSDLPLVDLGQGDSVGDLDTAGLTLLDGDVGRFPVEADTKALEFVDHHPQVVQRFQHVEHNPDEVTCSCDGDDLFSTTFTVLGCTLAQEKGQQIPTSLDNTRQVEDLDLGAVVDHLSWHRGERCELVRRRF